MNKKPASKTHFVMVTFGVNQSKLMSKFNRLRNKEKKSASAFGRELILEGMQRRLESKQ